VRRAWEQGQDPQPAGAAGFAGQEHPCASQRQAGLCHSLWRTVGKKLLSRDPSREDNRPLVFAKDHCQQRQKPEVIPEALHPKLLPPLMPSEPSAVPNHAARLTATSPAHRATLSHSTSLHRPSVCPLPGQPMANASQPQLLSPNRCHHPAQKRCPLPEGKPLLWDTTETRAHLLPYPPQTGGTNASFRVARWEI